MWAAWRKSRRIGLKPRPGTSGDAARALARAYLRQLDALRRGAEYFARVRADLRTLLQNQLDAWEEAERADEERRALARAFKKYRRSHRSTAAERKARRRQRGRK